MVIGEAAAETRTERASMDRHHALLVDEVGVEGTSPADNEEEVPYFFRPFDFGHDCPRRRFIALLGALLAPAGEREIKQPSTYAG